MAENLKHSLDYESESSQKPTKIAKTEYFIEEDGAEDQRESSIVPQPMREYPNVQRYLVAIEYIGTRFFGSQQQRDLRTVCGVLEEAFQKFIGQRVPVFCSSRTDAGVHALSNVCHVDVARISKRKPGQVLPPHEPGVVRKAVNHFLQRNGGDILVNDVRCVPPDFHARYKAQERTYFYRLLSGPEHLSAFEKDRAWHVPEELDLFAMQEASKVLVGHHDFSSFRASGCQAASPIRTLDELHVLEVPSTPYFPSATEIEQLNCSVKDRPVCSNKDENHPIVCPTSNDDILGSFNGGSNRPFGIKRRHRCYVVTARSRSFLYHQVRLLVGVLKAVGSGDITVSDVERILNAKSVTAASPMAPASGLYLGHVKYDLPQI